MAIAAAAASSLIGSDLAVVSVTIRTVFKLGNVLAIWVEGHGGGPIVEVDGLQTDAEHGDVNEALVLLHNITGTANDDEKATEQPPDKGI